MVIGIRMVTEGDVVGEGCTYLLCVTEGGSYYFDQFFLQSRTAIKYNEKFNTS